MKNPFEVHQFEVVLQTQSPWPKELSADFFRDSGIVPPDWQLGSERLTPQVVGAFTFTNDVGFFAQDGEFRFVEKCADKKRDDFVVPMMAVNYLAVLKHFDLSSVKFDIKGHVERENDDVGSLVIDRFLADGPWKTFSAKLMDANIGFAYDYGDALCLLHIKNSTFLDKDNEKQVLAFFATFVHNIVGASVQERTELGVKTVSEWRNDFERYLEIVQSVFLG